MINLQRLERFVILATNKNSSGEKDINISRVAEKLYIPQPHLSKEISQLEEEIDVKLFIRNPRLELTDYGKAFLTQAEHLLVQVKQLAQFTNQASQGEIGRLTIGINTSISNSLLPEVVRTFQQRFPNVDLVLQELLFKESRQRLENHTLDVDFDNLYNLKDVDSEHSLTYEIVTKDSLVMVLPESHPQAHKSQVELKDLANEPFILPSPESVPGLHTIIHSACLQAGFTPRVVQEAAWMTTILGLVAGEMGVALLPANVINLQRSGVVYRIIPEQLPVFQMAIVWLRNNQSKILSNFLEVTREISQKMDEKTDCL